MSNLLTKSNYLLLFCFYCLLFAGFAYSQTDEEGIEEVILQIESPLVVFLDSENISEPITISGRSNLPAGTIIKMNISGKMTSLKGGRFELINTYHIIVDQDGNWYQVIKPLQKMPFLDEAYKIEIGFNNKYIKLLQEKGVPNEVLSQKDCYYLTVISPVICKQRAEDILFLYQIITDFWSLDKELKQFISDIENIKEGKTGWEKLIGRTLGVYQSREESMTSAVKKWQEWEKDYIERLDNLSERVQPGRVTFITVQERIRSLIASLYEEYAQYRFQLLGAPRKISYYPTSTTLSNPGENKDNILMLMENEITSKIFQDIVATIEYIDKIYNSSSSNLEQWLKTKDDSGRLCLRLKNELDRYYQIGLFNRLPNKHFLKQSEDLIDIIETILLILDKLNPGGLDAEQPQEKQEEIQNLLTVLNNKISILSAALY